MLSDSLQTLVLTDQELEWLQQMRSVHNHKIVENSLESFDVLRRCYAYNGNLELASKKLKRHLKIRKILRLDHIHLPNSGHEIDELANDYSPLTFLGNTGTDNTCAVFLEQSGRFDLTGMMEKIRLSSFMLNKFKQMEGILNATKEIERSSQKMSKAILIIDLKDLSFHSNLISFISGTYRIVWGTLMEQYPFLFKHFIIVNAPSFMNLLWSACSSFIPAEYKEKIHLLNTNTDYSLLHQFVDPSILSLEYGGHSQIQIRTPVSCNVQPIERPENTNLESIYIPAGKSTVLTYYLLQDQELQAYLLCTQEFTLNMFYSADKKTLTNPQKEVEDLEEVYSGCERPGLPSLDAWNWKAPTTGFYHVIFGNEKAWLLSVNIEFQLFQLHSNGAKIKVNPIPI